MNGSIPTKEDKIRSVVNSYAPTLHKMQNLGVTSSNMQNISHDASPYSPLSIWRENKEDESGSVDDDSNHIHIHPTHSDDSSKTESTSTSTSSIMSEEYIPVDSTNNVHQQKSASIHHVQEHQNDHNHHLQFHPPQVSQLHSARTISAKEKDETHSLTSSNHSQNSFLRRLILPPLRAPLSLSSSSSSSLSPKAAFQWQQQQQQQSSQQEFRRQRNYNSQSSCRGQIGGEYELKNARDALVGSSAAIINFLRSHGVPKPACDQLNKNLKMKRYFAVLQRVQNYIQCIPTRNPQEILQQIHLAVTAWEKLCRYKAIEYQRAYQVSFLLRHDPQQCDDSDFDFIDYSNDISSSHDNCSDNDKVSTKSRTAMMTTTTTTTITTLKLEREIEAALTLQIKCAEQLTTCQTQLYLVRKWERYWLHKLRVRRSCD